MRPEDVYREAAEEYRGVGPDGPAIAFTTLLIAVCAGVAWLCGWI